MPLLYSEIELKHNVVTGFCCDRCKATHLEEDVFEMQESMHWKKTGGYGSKWGDGSTVEVTLCEQCTIDLFSDFAQCTTENIQFG